MAANTKEPGPDTRTEYLASRRGMVACLHPILACLFLFVPGIALAEDGATTPVVGGRLPDGRPVSADLWMLDREGFGIDASRGRSRLVVSREEGVEVFDTATGLRIGNDVPWPDHRYGRGVAAEDELDGVLNRYAYAIATEEQDMFGEIRALDLVTPQFVANSQGEVALATIEGKPVDIEIRPAPSTVYAYVTSAVEDSGDCPTGGMGAMAMSGDNEIIPDPGGGGGGGPRHRRTILTVFDMDRPSFDNVQQRQTFDLSCVSIPQPAYVDEIGLAWNEQRDKLYVVVPDADKVFGISCCGAGGDLVGDPSTWQGIGLPVQRPTDIIVGKFDLGTGPIEMAVVTALGVPDSLLPGEFPGVMRFVTGNPLLMQQLFFESGSKPVSLSTHPDAGPNGVVVIADRGQQAIRVVRVNQTGLEEVQRLATATIPTRVTVQGQLGKAQPGN